MVVVGAINNNLLGENLITKFRCNWSFDEGSFIINGSSVPLQAKDGYARAGRVIPIENVLVPAAHEKLKDKQ